MATPTPAFPHAGGPAPASPTRPRTSPLQWFARGGWYVVVVVLSLGMLAFVPFVHAAIRTRKPLMWLWVVLYTSAVVTLFVLAGNVDIGGFAIALMIIASIHAVVLRSQVWPVIRTQNRSAGHPVADTTDPAVAAVLAARARREDARRLAAADPHMARELGVGQPDRARAYDDGGLVDLNNASAQAIAHTCGIDLGVATQIVEARARGITFSTVDEVFSLIEIPYPVWDRIRDRALVIT